MITYIHTYVRQIMQERDSLFLYRLSTHLSTSKLAPYSAGNILLVYRS